MREVHRSQFQLGQVPVEKVWINPKSRDDIPAVLKGLQHIWCDEALRARLFVLLDEHILPPPDRTVGRRRVRGRRGRRLQRCRGLRCHVNIFKRILLRYNLPWKWQAAPASSGPRLLGTQ